MWLLPGIHDRRVTRGWREAQSETGSGLCAGQSQAHQLPLLLAPAPPGCNECRQPRSNHLNPSFRKK
jgi:hypothetical protein